MKQIFFLLFFSLTINYANAKSLDSTTIVVFGKSYVVKVGDTLQLGYGSNPDGSFMYLSLGAGDKKESLGKEYAGKTVVIKKIRYFKITDQIEVIIKGKNFSPLALFPQAIEKLEIVSINGVEFKPR